MNSTPFRSLLLLVGVVTSAKAQQAVPLEISELRSRVAAIRAEMPKVTAAADYVAASFTRDPTARFLLSGKRSTALRAEFEWHTGASPEMRDADDPGAHGIVLLPVSSWETGGLTVAMLLEQWQAAGNPVIIIGSSAGMPDGVHGRLVPNGAPDGTRAEAAINDAANLIAAWTLYVEFVASATRQKWQPGIFVSHLVPLADDSNFKIKFHAATTAPVLPIAAGKLGGQYLDRIDSLLNLAAKPQHQLLVQKGADSLRALRAAGHHLFVSACAHYLQASVMADTARSPFRPVNGRNEIAGPLNSAGAKPGDALLWFGYDGFDCPHVQAAGPLRDAGFKVVVVGDRLPRPLPSNVLAAIPLGARLPEQIGTVPFDQEGAGSATSVDALLHYLWLKRLVGMP